MRIEERVRRAVENAVAHRPSDLGSWERLRIRARGDRTRRLAVAVAGASAMIAAVAVAVPRLAGDGGSQRPYFSGGAPDTPSVIVALDRGGAADGDERLVAIDPTTGKERRELARASGEGETVSSFGTSISLTPDGKTLYYVRTTGGPCGSRILSVAVNGGVPRQVAEGSAVASSPDGGRLAYVARGTGPECLRPDLVVRDLATGTEKRWRWDAGIAGDPYQQGGPNRLSWSPDGQRIAFERNVGDPLAKVWVLDVTRGETILDATEITPRDKEWSSPAFLPDGRLVVVEGIRSIHDPKGVSGRILAVDPTDGRTLQEIRGEVDGLLSIDASRDGDIVNATESGIFRIVGGSLVKVASGDYGSAIW